MSTRPKDQLLEALKANNYQTEVALREIYQTHFPPIQKMILQKGGSKEQAKDIFQESIIGLMQLIRKDQYRADASIKTVLYAIARNLWHDHLRKTKKTEDLSAFEDTKGVEMPIPSGDELIQKRLLRTLFGQISPDCRKIISLYYYQNWSMEMIRKEMDYANTKVTRNKKYKCMQRLIEVFKKHQIDSTRFE